MNKNSSGDEESVRKSCSAKLEASHGARIMANEFLQYSFTAKEKEIAFPKQALVGTDKDISDLKEKLPRGALILLSRRVNQKQKSPGANHKHLMVSIVKAVGEGSGNSESASGINLPSFIYKINRRKVEREVNLKMAEEIKAGGESSWWQGDCKPNRTRTVTAILESAMIKEEGQEERLSEHQFSKMVICD
ncbi:hypothetical protein pdam_00006863 [Pocillopora damicornis]|uniref:Uncharacterized protein n=1 Tax=Pocillopora damicornis TaxID=46731 RepID=A0A3M6TP72_POCDA|nr:hypothetical protein pdam_00006863 [Pocillopora damicornis]